MCARPEVDPEWFFPVGDRDRDAAEAALELCARCPVRERCLFEALALPATQDGGIRGGMTEWRRSRMPRRRVRDQLAQQLGLVS